MDKKAVILAGGRGKRLFPLSKFYNKAELPILNKPLFMYNIRILAESGVNVLIFVLPPDSDRFKVAVSRFVSREFPGIGLSFIVQEQPKGIGHAVSLTQQYMDGPFIVLLGDTLFLSQDLDRGYQMLRNGRADAVLSVRYEPDAGIIKKECTIRLDSSGEVRQIIEKPKSILSHHKPCGIYFFNPSIFRVLTELRPSKLRNEIEITDAIAMLIEKGFTVRTAQTVDMDVNISTVDDFRRTNLMMLRKQGLNRLIAASASVGNGVYVDNSVIGDHVTIEDNCRIIDSVILPYSRVLSGSEVINTVIFPRQNT